MNLSEIHKLLYEWCEKMPGNEKDLLTYWYINNNVSLAKTLITESGSKIILNTNSFSSLEPKLKKLYLFADIIAVRDIRPIKINGPLHIFPVPVDFSGFEYKVDFPENRPILMQFLEQNVFNRSIYRGKDEKLYSMLSGTFQCFYDDFYKWILNDGRNYFETGQFVFAPFILPLEVELEFLKQGFSLPQHFDSFPLFSDVADYIDDKSVTALLNLKLPTFENVDIKTIQKIKNDNYDDFVLFRNNILNCIQGVKGEVGTPEFLKEIKYIQRNNIDDSIAKIDKKVKTISQMQSLRTAGCTIGTLGLSFGALFGLPETAIIAGATASISSWVANTVLKLKESGELKEQQNYFLWRIINNNK